jgi:hypothetical protein
MINTNIVLLLLLLLLPPIIEGKNQFHAIIEKVNVVSDAAIKQLYIINITFQHEPRVMQFSGVAWHSVRASSELLDAALSMWCEGRTASFKRDNEHVFATMSSTVPVRACVVHHTPLSRQVPPFTALLRPNGNIYSGTSPVTLHYEDGEEDDIIPTRDFLIECQDKVDKEDKEEVETHYSDYTHDPHSISFVELQAFTKMIGGVLKMLTSPILDDVENDVVGNQVVSLSSETGTVCDVRTPPQVLALTTEPLKMTLVNMMVDAVTLILSDMLTQSIVDSMGPLLVKSIADAAVPRLHRLLEPMLIRDVSADLTAGIPDALLRGLPSTLADSLTRSLAHALLPVVTQAVSITSSGSDKESAAGAHHQHRFCWSCYYYNTDCARCKVGADSLYYSQYYAAYIADYFSDYYAPYFVNATLRVGRQRQQ